MLIGHHTAWLTWPWTNSDRDLCPVFGNCSAPFNVHTVGTHGILGEKAPSAESDHLITKPAPYLKPMFTWIYCVEIMYSAPSQRYTNIDLHLMWWHSDGVQSWLKFVSLLHVVPPLHFTTLALNEIVRLLFAGWNNVLRFCCCLQILFPYAITSVFSTGQLDRRKWGWGRSAARLLLKVVHLWEATGVKCV